MRLSQLRKLVEELSTGGGGSSGVQMFRDEQLVEQNAEDVTAPLVLTIPVENGDLIDITHRLEARATSDPLGGALSISYVESGAGLLDDGGPLDSDLGFTLWETWRGETIEIQGAESPSVFMVRSSGVLTLTFTLSIGDSPVPVDIRNWRVIARRYTS